MVQGEGRRCLTQPGKYHRCLGKSGGQVNCNRPLNSKYSTVNFAPPLCPPIRNHCEFKPKCSEFRCPSSNVSSQTQRRRSCGQRTHLQHGSAQRVLCYNGGSSSISCRLLDILKCLQQQCQLRKKDIPDCSRKLLLLHENILTAITDLKHDLERISEMEKNSCAKFVLSKDGESAGKILARMSCRMFELQDTMNKPCLPTCTEVLTRRRNLLGLIKTLQKSASRQLEREIEATQVREEKLCSLLKGLHCAEMQLCNITKGIKSVHCADCVEDEAYFGRKCVTATSTEPTSVDCRTLIQCETKAVSCGKELIPSTTDVATCARKHSQTSVKSFSDNCPVKTVKVCPPNCTKEKSQNLDNYEVTGVDIVYTKSRVHTPPDDGNQQISANSEECIIDKMVKCHIPCDSDSSFGIKTCDIKVCDGNKVINLSETDPLRNTLCRMSNIWYESAKQLAESFSKC